MPLALGAGWAWMLGGGTSPCDLPERVALDAQASLARRVGASAAHAHHRSFPISTRWLVEPQMTYVTNCAALYKAFDLRVRVLRGRRQAAPSHHIPSNILNRRSNVRKGTHPRLPG